MLDTPTAQELKRDPNLRLGFSGAIGVHYLDFFDQWDPKSPWADRRVRLAANHALDRKALSEAETLGASRPTGSMAPRTFDFTLPLPAYEYDPGKAKKLLAEAGYPNGFEAVLKVAPQYYYTVRTGEVLADQLQKVGVKIKIEQIEWGQWLSRVWKDADYDLTIIGHAEAWDVANYANPKYYFRYDSPEFQKIFQESEVTVDDKARRELYVKIQKKLVEDAPVVWLYIHPRLVVTKKGLQGLWKDLPAGAGVNDLSEVAWVK
jgi:peptide/nickel transport system substrate-binding protein